MLRQKTLVVIGQGSVTAWSCCLVKRARMEISAYEWGVDCSVVYRARL